MTLVWHAVCLYNKSIASKGKTKTCFQLPDCTLVKQFPSTKEKNKTNPPPKKLLDNFKGFNFIYVSATAVFTEGQGIFMESVCYLSKAVICCHFDRHTIKQIIAGGLI